MRYGIYSDVHSNLEAFEAVIAKLEQENCEKYVCCGDIVVYGANPRECLYKVLELESLVVAGNHDYAATGKLNTEFFGAFAQFAVDYTRRQLSRKEMNYLANLDLVQNWNNVFTLVHGSLNFPEYFDYIQTSYEAYISLNLLETPVGFLGHSHVPVTFFDGETITFSLDEEIDVVKNRKILVNVGSVGQPRDGNTLACCAVYDDKQAKVWIHRVEYDIDTAVSKIIAAGLPEVLAERLRYGR